MQLQKVNRMDYFKATLELNSGGFSANNNNNNNNVERKNRIKTRVPVCMVVAALTCRVFEIAHLTKIITCYTMYRRGRFEHAVQPNVGGNIHYIIN